MRKVTGLLCSFAKKDSNLAVLLERTWNSSELLKDTSRQLPQLCLQVFYRKAILKHLAKLTQKHMQRSFLLKTLLHYLWFRGIFTKYFRIAFFSTPSSDCSGYSLRNHILFFFSQFFKSHIILKWHHTCLSSKSQSLDISLVLYATISTEEYLEPGLRSTIVLFSENS